MAIERTITNPAASEVDRTYWMNIITPISGDYCAQVYRETVQRDGKGKVVGAPAQNPTPITKTLTAFLADQPVEVTLEDGSTVQVTPEMILKALPQFCDRWAAAQERGGK